MLAHFRDITALKSLNVPKSIVNDSTKPEAFWMLYHKARILKIMGKKKEAINTANSVIDVASGKKEDYGYIRKSKDLITSIKSKK